MKCAGRIVGCFCVVAGVGLAAVGSVQAESSHDAARSMYQNCADEARSLFQSCEKMKEAEKADCLDHAMFAAGQCADMAAKAKEELYNPAGGGVNPKNGNFFITYQDISLTKGRHELAVLRTYNSLSTQVGWFGRGWGTPFETRLLIMPGGSAVITESGGGQLTYYVPQGEAHVQETVDAIVAVATQRDNLTPEAVQELRKKLVADSERRIRAVEKYGIKAQLADGTVVQLKEGGCNKAATVQRIGDEYKRTSCGNGTDYFNLAGQLIRREQDGYTVTIHYTGKGPESIEDSLGQKIFFKCSDGGQVVVSSTNPDFDLKKGFAEKYTYSSDGNLVLADIPWGNFYRYSYDGHNKMTRIDYMDNTHMDMAYNDHDTVTMVVKPLGGKMEYAYRTDPANPTGHYWTTITATNVDGEVESKEVEFFLNTDAAGVTQVSGVRTARNQEQKDIVFDEKGRPLRQRTSDGEYKEYFYHPTLGKVSAIASTKRSTAFAYDEAGNLMRIFNTDGELIHLSYDSKKRINHMLVKESSDKKRRELTFAYNDSNQPTKITMKGVGEINVTYDEQGEIANVQSPQGSRMALQVTLAFQTLLQMVREAGVEWGK